MLLLKYRGTTTIPLEAECIRPDHLAGLAGLAIARLPLQHGNTQVPLGEFFEIAVNAADGEVVLEGECSRVKWLGAAMAGGRLRIEGHAGMHLGAEMKGGLIEVRGNAGGWVGAAMRGGRIHVRGDAGHLVGAGYRGSLKGMRGGVILVDGKAGNEVGAAMRRGLIAIGGEVGDFAGVSMVAGSVFLFGAAGVRLGAGMKRGTIATFGPPPQLLPTFRFDCVYRPVFL